jgi:hypothetical protein
LFYFRVYLFARPWFSTQTFSFSKNLRHPGGLKASGPLPFGPQSLVSRPFPTFSRIAVTPLVTRNGILLKNVYLHSGRLRARDALIVVDRGAIQRFDLFVCGTRSGGVNRRVGSRSDPLQWRPPRQHIRFFVVGFVLVFELRESKTIAQTSVQRITV